MTHNEIGVADGLNGRHSTTKEDCDRFSRLPFHAAGAVTPAVGLAPSQINWCRDNIPGFRAMHDQAEKARQETEENRRRMVR